MNRSSVMCVRKQLLWCGCSLETLDEAESNSSLGVHQLADRVPFCARRHRQLLHLRCVIIVFGSKAAAAVSVFLTFIFHSALTIHAVDTLDTGCDLLNESE
jgi:hypothetical protein